MEIYKIENKVPGRINIDPDQLEFLERFHMKDLFWDYDTGGATKEQLLNYGI
jgi:hypothetical protein